MGNFNVVLLLFFVVKLLQLMCVVVASCNWECVPFTVLNTEHCLQNRLASVCVASSGTVVCWRDVRYLWELLHKLFE